MIKGLSLVVALCVVLVAVAYSVLRGGQLYGPYVVAMTVLPLVATKLVRLEFRGLLPDVIFGAVDTGLLTLAALIGAMGFGVIGAVLGAVVGDAITDAIAGFFEGSVAEWLRRRGINESRTAAALRAGKWLAVSSGAA